MNDDDRIGYIGLNEFFSLCERERLYASRPDPDRTGKDFVVEWKPDEEWGFDTRPPPRKCQVQVMSTRLGSRQVRVKLSAAEWLAKDLAPAFILCRSSMLKSKSITMSGFISPMNYLKASWRGTLSAAG